MIERLRQAIEARWYGKPGWLLWLWPLSLLFRTSSRLRRRRLEQTREPLEVPVIIVGNITVGGTGKTPLLIALVQLLQEAGLRPGVISRGYGAAQPGSAGERVRLVTRDSTAEAVGDEPLLIAQATGCPVAVGANRVAAARELLRDSTCDIILSDDGLQHYRLPRQLEVVVVDASRGFGNGLNLPVGPLREPLERLQTVDWIIRNGNQPCAQLDPWQPVPMRLRPTAWVNVKTGVRKALDDRSWLREPAYAVAGIGNPERFFKSLIELGLTIFPKPFPDHYRYQPADFTEFSGETVLMTAKDAVKCREFAQPEWWYLNVAAELPVAFRGAFTERVQALVSAS